MVGDEEGAVGHWWGEVGVVFDLEVTLLAVEVELLGEEVGPWQGCEFVLTCG